MMIRLGHWFFRTRDAVFPVVFLSLAFAIKPVVIENDWWFDAVIDAFGICVALVGQILRAAVIGFAYITRGGQNRRVYADTLVQEGIFAHCRNPLYLGNILLLVGMAIVHGSPLFMLLVSIFFFFAYFAIVRAEEEFLHEKFGQVYDEYCRKVSRFILSPGGLSRSLVGLRFDWRKLLRKEYGTSFTWVSGVLALLVWERVSMPGPSIESDVVLVIGTIWMLLVVAYSTVRVLKLRGALGAG